MNWIARTGRLVIAATIVAALILAFDWGAGGSPALAESDPQPPQWEEIGSEHELRSNNVEVI